MSSKRKRNSTTPRSRQEPTLTEAQMIDRDELKAAMLNTPDEQVTVGADGIPVIPSRKSRPESQYRFRIEGNDRVWSIPNLQHIDVETALKLNDKSLAEEDLLRLILGKHEPDLLGSVDALELGHIAKEWRNHSLKGATTAVGLGESGPSSSS